MIHVHMRNLHADIEIQLTLLIRLIPAVRRVFITFTSLYFGNLNIDFRLTLPSHLGPVVRQRLAVQSAFRSYISPRDASC